MIEDAAEALGATYQGRPAGSVRRVGVFSFNGNKIITTSGGGMLVSDRTGRGSTGRASSPPRPATRRRTTSTRRIGYNYRLSNLLAAVGRGQLRVLDERVDAAPGEQRLLPRRARRPPGHRASCPRRRTAAPTAG